MTAKFEDVMVDLETLGKRAGCTVLSIGAVAFDPVTRQLGPEFHVKINRMSCFKLGLVEDPETVKWWNKRPAEARQLLDEVDHGKGDHLRDALNKLTAYLIEFDLDHVKMWGNGSDFDNAILINCYAAIGEQETPWRFSNNRCYRTLKNLNKKIELERTGLRHSALDDAVSQAKHAIRILNPVEWP